MRDHAPEHGPVAFHFDEGPPKLGLFCALRDCLLAQTAKAVMLALNPKDVLNFLASTCARNASGQKRTTKDFSTAEPACANKPKALSTSIKRGAANGEEFARRTCSFVKQNSSLPEQVGSFFGAEWR